MVEIDEKTESNPDSMIMTYKINVTQIFKQGNSKFKTKKTYWFIKPAICQYPDLGLGEHVLIMGKHKNGVQYLDRDTFVKTLGRRQKRFVNKLVAQINQVDCD